MLKRKNRGYYQVAGKHFIGPNELLPWTADHPVMKANRSDQVRGLIIVPSDDKSGFEYAWVPSLKLLPLDASLYVLTFDHGIVSEADAWLQVSDYLERGKKVSQFHISLNISIRKRKNMKSCSRAVDAIKNGSFARQSINGSISPEQYAQYSEGYVHFPMGQYVQMSMMCSEDLESLVPHTATDTSTAVLYESRGIGEPNFYHVSGIDKIDKDKEDE